MRKNVKPEPVYRNPVKMDCYLLGLQDKVFVSILCSHIAFIKPGIGRVQQLKEKKKLNKSFVKTYHCFTWGVKFQQPGTKRWKSFSRRKKTRKTTEHKRSIYIVASYIHIRIKCRIHIQLSTWQPHKI